MWSLCWLLTCGLLVLAAGVLPTKVAKVIPLLPLLGIAFVLALSGAWFPALLALWLTALCAGIGIYVLQILVGKEYDAVEYVVCAIPIGTGVIALAVLSVGLSGQLTPDTVWLFVLSLSALTLWIWRRQIFALQFQTLTAIKKQLFMAEYTVVYAVIAAIAFFYSLWAIAPEIQYDALNYHLAVPAKYLQSSRIVELPYYHAYFARLIELFLTVCLAIGGPATAKLWVFLMSICAVGAVYALGCRTFERRVGLWAAAFFAMTPLVGWLSSTTYLENILALTVTSSFIALVRWEDSRKAGWLYAAALLMGIAIGSKVNTILAYLLIVPIVAMQVVLTRSENLSAKIRVIGTAAVVAGVFALPTYWVTYSFTGNPIFPLFNGIFKSPKWALTNAIMNASDYGIPPTTASLIRFPFRLTLDTIRFGEALPRGSVGVMLLLAFPFGLFLWSRVRFAVKILLIAAAGYLVALFYTMQYARYYILILPLAAVFGVATVWTFAPRSVLRWVPVALLVLLIIQPLVYSLQFWNIPERLPIALALGLEDKTSFLRRALPGYKAAEYLNTVTNAKDRILGVGTENLRFYLQAELPTWALGLRDDPLIGLARMQPDAALAGSIKQLGFKYLLVERNATLEHGSEFPYLDSTFLQTFTIPVFEDESVAVYRLL